MEKKERILEILNKWFTPITFVIWFILVIFAFAEIIFRQEPVKQGLVMNKWASESYEICEKGKCTTVPMTRVVAVQNGDQKAYWLVSEEYFDSVKIGSWVSK